VEVEGGSKKVFCHVDVYRRFSVLYDQEGIYVLDFGCCLNAYINKAIVLRPGFDSVGD
jgi:hypothetical protein